MRILISGGIKTPNIVNSLKARFTSGGVDFVIVPYIEEIEDLFARGEYYDRAIIIEQCWNHDSEDNDERSIRTKVNDFAKNMASRKLKGVNYVFLTQTEETAAYVYEEILPLRVDSVIVVKAPKYTINFFAGLVTSDIEQFPDNMVYKPKLEETRDLTMVKLSDNDFQVTANINENENDSERVTNIEDLSNDLFGEEIYEDNIDMEELSNDLFSEVDQDNSFSNSFENISTELFDEELNNANIFDNNEDNISSFDNNEETQDESTFKTGTEFTDDDWDNNFNTEEQLEENVNNLENELITTANVNGAPEDLENTGDNNDIEVDEVEYMSLQTKSINNEEINLNELENNTQSSDNMDNQLPNIVNDTQYKDSQPLNQSEINSSLEGFNDEDYEDAKNNIGPTIPSRPRVDMSNDQIKAALDAFAQRGNSIVVTGCGGCGTSTIAYNLANTIANIGYTVLLVDMDTKGRAQSYISKENYNSMEPDGANLMAALNSSSGINAHVAIVRAGFRLLSMGIGGDTVKLDKIIQKQKLTRFANLAKTSHNFVIYDVPFEDITGCANDILFTADNIVIVMDSSNWGITKTMLDICNIDSDDVMDTVFSNGQLLFNRYKGFNKIMGRKVKSAIDITKTIDLKVRELTGTDPSYYFQTMHICGIVNDDREFEDGWFSENQYSNTNKGHQQFVELLKNIVLKR